MATEAKESTTVMNVDQQKTAVEIPNKTEQEQRPLSNDECANLLEEGRKLCRAAEYAKATETLSTAVEHFVKKNGAMSVEAAVYYFEYGRALLRLAQNSVDVFGDAMRQKNAALNAAEQLQEIVAAAVLPAIANGSCTDEPTPTATETVAKSETTKAETETETEPVTEPTTEPTTEPISTETSEDVEVGMNGDSKEEESPNAEIGPSDEDDKEVSWQVIELARVILENDLSLNPGNTDRALMLAEVMALAAEHQLEDEKFEEAHADYLKCIDLRQKYLDEDHRDVAAAHFMAGIVCEYAGDLDNADAHFTNSLVGLTNWTETKLAELGAEIPALSDKAEELTLREAIDRVLKPSEVYLEQNKDAEPASVTDLVSVTESIRSLWERIELLKREPDELSQIQKVAAGEVEIPQIPLPSDTAKPKTSEENGVTEAIGFGDVPSQFDDAPVNERNASKSIPQARHPNRRNRKWMNPQRVKSR
jgi:tetratricopeptide (TPR) repeat protein